MLHVGPICCTWAAGAQLYARALLLAGQLPEPTSGCWLYHLNGKPNFLEPSRLSAVESGEQGRFRVPLSGSPQWRSHNFVAGYSHFLRKIQQSKKVSRLMLIH
jgi:hypothetical protein